MNLIILLSFVFLVKGQTRGPTPDAPLTLPQLLSGGKGWVASTPDAGTGWTSSTTGPSGTQVAGAQSIGVQGISGINAINDTFVASFTAAGGWPAAATLAYEFTPELLVDTFAGGIEAETTDQIANSYAPNSHAYTYGNHSTLLSVTNVENATIIASPNDVAGTSTGSLQESAFVQVTEGENIVGGGWKSSKTEEVASAPVTSGKGWSSGPSVGSTATAAEVLIATDLASAMASTDNVSALLQGNGVDPVEVLYNQNMDNNLSTHLSNDGDYVATTTGYAEGYGVAHEVNSNPSANFIFNVVGANVVGLSDTPSVSSTTSTAGATLSEFVYANNGTGSGIFTTGGGNGWKQ